MSLKGRACDGVYSPESRGQLNCVFCVCDRINGHLVALKVIHMKTEEGIPFTAIREGTATAQLTQPRIKSAYTHTKGRGVF